MTMPNAPDQLVCPLGITERALSSYRDARANRGADDRLAAHVATCPACSARLAAFESLAGILRSEHPPEPDERLWPAITAATDATDAAGAPSPFQRLRVSGLPPGAWSRVGALVAVLLLTIGFVALFSLRRPVPPAQPTATTTLAPGATATPAATATSQPSLIPAGPLVWRPADGASDAQGMITFADDGKSAYRCLVTDDAQGNSILNIWRTADRGAHWTPARVIPRDPTVNGCELVVDVNDPSVAALAWQPRGGGAGDSFTGLMTTVDGGVTWQASPPQPFEQIDQLDTRGGAIYALRETVFNNGVEYHLWVSNDRMRSWRRLDHDITQPVAGFWLQPDGDGILLVTSTGEAGSGSQLWSSPDGGFNWRQLNVPGGTPSYMTARFTGAGAPPNGIVARWLQGRFHICVSNATVAMSTPTASDVTCSTDGGATWQARPLPLVTSGVGPSVSVNLVSLTNDGAVLAADGASLYRLPASSSRWQSLGALPEVFVYYAPTPGAGILWAAPDVLGDPTDPQGRIFTADYTP